MLTWVYSYIQDLVEKERNLAVSLLDINKDLKIIDTSYVLETDYSNEELWLNPSNG